MEIGPCVLKNANNTCVAHPMVNNCNSFSSNALLADHYYISVMLRSQIKLTSYDFIYVIIMNNAPKHTCTILRHLLFSKLCLCCIP